MTLFSRQNPVHIQRSAKVARHIFLLTAVLLCITGTLYAQSRTAPEPTIAPPPAQRQRAITAANGPAILSPEQLSTLRANNEQARLLQMYPFDIMWGLP